jgi:hypothetical protein
VLVSLALVVCLAANRNESTPPTYVRDYEGMSCLSCCNADGQYVSEIDMLAAKSPECADQARSAQRQQAPSCAVAVCTLLSLSLSLSSPCLLVLWPLEVTSLMTAVSALTRRSLSPPSNEVFFCCDLVTVVIDYAAVVVVSDIYVVACRRVAPNHEFAFDLHTNTECGATWVLACLCRTCSWHSSKR